MCQPDKREETVCTEALRQEGPSWKQGVPGVWQARIIPLPALLQEMQSDKQAEAPWRACEPRHGWEDLSSKPTGSCDGLSAALIMAASMFSKTPRMTVWRRDNGAGTQQETNRNVAECRKE